MSEDSPWDDDQAAEAIASALARAREAGSARIELLIGERPMPPMPPELRPPTGVLRHPMRSFAAWVVKTGSAARRTQGVIDFRSRRYMLFGPYAQVYADGEHRGGAPGRTLSSLTVNEGTPPVPLWLCDLPDGVASAREIGREDVRNRPCRILAIDLDARSVASLPAPWSVSPGDLRPEVWIDVDGYVCRVRVHAEDRAQTLELWDFGVCVDSLDWTRLPAPEAAGEVEGPGSSGWLRQGVVYATGSVPARRTFAGTAALMRK